MKKKNPVRMPSFQFRPYFLNPLRINPLIGAESIALAFPSALPAANYQWDVNSNTAGLGGTGTWNTTNAFWDDTAGGANDGTETTIAPTFTGADTAIFGGTAGNVTVDAVTVGGLNFTSSGYNLCGGTITLGANTTILQTTSSTNTTTISSKITGTPKLILNATSFSFYANLTLSGANDHSGGTDLNHNTIVTIGNAAAFGTGTVTVNGFFGQLRASSGLTIANNIVLNNDWGLYGSNNVTTNGTLNLGGGTPRTITVDTGRTFAIGGNTSNGALTKSGSGILRLTNSSYTGATTVSNGTLRIRNTSNSSGFSIASGANLELTNLSLTSSQNITGSGNVSTDGSLFGAVTLNGNNNNYTGTTTVTIDRLRLGAGGVINGTSGITVQGQWSSNFENFGTATSSGAVNVNGYAGSGSNTASGIFYNGNAAGTTPGSLTAASITLGGSFRSDAAGTAKGGEFFNYVGSTVGLGAGAITVNGQGNSLAGGMVAAGSTFTNVGSVTAGSITLNSSSTANSASNKGGTYTQSGGGTALSGGLTLAPNSGTGMVGTAGNDAVFNLDGGTFSANSVAVNSGTLSITGGSLTTTSGLSVNGGTLLLGGSGVDSRMNNSSAVALGGDNVPASKLQLGNAPVTETMGALTLSSGTSVRVIDFGDTAFAQNGKLTFASLTGSSATALQIWNWSGSYTGNGGDQLIISSGALAGGLALTDISFFGGSGSLPLGTAAFSSGNSLELVPVPEPGAITALVFLAGLAFSGGRRHAAVRRHCVTCQADDPDRG